MRFIDPAFLFALSAIAVPIIIHLFNFRRYKKVYFSNVRFLKEVKQETQSRSKLKHLLILCCRILAIALIALAFAQPYIPSANTKVVTGEKAVSIFIDNSFSMDAVNKSGTLLDEAKKRAQEILAGYGPTDKFQLLTNDFEGKHQRLVNKEEFLEMLDEVKISPSVKDLPAVCSRIFDLLDKSNAAKKKAFLLSDFQKSISTLDQIRNDSAVEVVMVPLIAQEKNNIFIDSCWFESPVRQPGQSEKVNVRIRNVSPKAVENNSIRLFINGQQKTPASFSVEAGGGTTVVLSFASKGTGVQQCRIELNDYPVTFDDKFYFSFNVEKDIPVLCINSTPKTADAQNPGNENRNLVTLFRDSLFRLTNVPESKIDYSSFSQYRLIVLNELKEISSGLSQELKRFTANGGSLVVFPAPETNLNSYKEFLSTVNADPYLSLDTVNTKVDRINFEHSIYHDVFEKKNENIDLPVVLGHYKISRSSHSNEEFLMRLQNGDAFLSQYNYKKGKVYLSAVPLDPEFSNFTRHALFVPTLYKIAVFSQHALPLFNTIGKDEVIEVSSTSVSGENVFHIRGDKSSIDSGKTAFDIIPEHKVNENSTDVFVRNQVSTGGNYLLLLGDSVLSGLSFNYDRKESDLSCFTPAELLQKKDAAGLNNFTLVEAGVKPLGDALEEMDQGIKLWKWCVLLALLFLAAEVALLRFWKA